MVPPQLSDTPVKLACDGHLKVPFSQPCDTPVILACDEHLKVLFSQISDTPVTLASDQDLVSFLAQPSRYLVKKTPETAQIGNHGDQLKIQVKIIYFAIF